MSSPPQTNCPGESPSPSPIPSPEKAAALPAQAIIVASPQPRADETLEQTTPSQTKSPAAPPAHSPFVQPATPQTSHSDNLESFQNRSTAVLSPAAPPATEAAAAPPDRHAKKHRHRVRNRKRKSTSTTANELTEKFLQSVPEAAEEPARETRTGEKPPNPVPRPLRIGTINAFGSSDSMSLAFTARSHNLDILAVTEVGASRTSNFTCSLQADERKKLPAREYVVLWKGVKKSKTDGNRTVAFLIDAEKFQSEKYNIAFHGDRVASLRFKFGKITSHVIVAYAPTIRADKTARDDFWEKLDKAVISTNGQHMVILGDLNAHINDDEYPSRLDPARPTNVNGSALTNLLHTFHLTALNVTEQFSQIGNIRRRNLWTWKSNATTASKPMPRQMKGTKKQKARVRARIRKQQEKHRAEHPHRHPTFHEGGRPSKRARDKHKLAISRRLDTAAELPAAIPATETTPAPQQEEAPVPAPPIEQAQAQAHAAAPTPEEDQDEIEAELSSFYRGGLRVNDYVIVRTDFKSDVFRLGTRDPCIVNGNGNRPDHQLLRFSFFPKFDRPPQTGTATAATEYVPPSPTTLDPAVHQARVVQEDAELENLHEELAALAQQYADHEHLRDRRATADALMKRSSTASDTDDLLYLATLQRARELFTANSTTPEWLTDSLNTPSPIPRSASPGTRSKSSAASPALDFAPTPPRPDPSPDLASPHPKNPIAEDPPPPTPPPPPPPTIAPPPPAAAKKENAPHEPPPIDFAQFSDEQRAAIETGATRIVQTMEKFVIRKERRHLTSPMMTPEGYAAVYAKHQALEVWRAHRTPATRNAFVIARRASAKILRQVCNKYWDDFAKKASASFEGDNTAEAFGLLRRLYRPREISFSKDEEERENCLRYFQKLYQCNPNTSTKEELARHFQNDNERQNAESKMASPESLAHRWNKLLACDNPLPRVVRPTPTRFLNVATDGSSEQDDARDHSTRKCGYGVFFPEGHQHGLANIHGRTFTHRGQETTTRGVIEAHLRMLIATHSKFADWEIRNVTASQVLISGIAQIRRRRENNFSDVDHADLWRHISWFHEESGRHIRMIKVKSRIDDDRPPDDDEDALSKANLLAAASRRRKPPPADPYPALMEKLGCTGAPAAPLPWRKMNDDVPTAEEIRSAMSKIHNKAPGPDGIKIKMIRDYPPACEKLIEIIKTSWEKKKVPTAWREGTVVVIPKKAGSTSYDDLRGICLLSHASKVLMRIILDRSRGIPLLEVQHGFKRADGTAAGIFTVKAMMDMADRVGLPLQTTFIDFRKAYDSCPRSFLWDTLEKYGFGSTTIELIKQCYNDKIHLRLNGKLSKGNFSSERGVRQGCLLSCLLFNLMLDRVIRTGIANMHAADPNLGIWLVNDKTGVRRRFILRAYADDIALFSKNTTEAAIMMKLFNDAAQLAGLEINAAKTETMRMQDDRNPPRPPPPTDLTATKPGRTINTVPPGQHPVGAHWYVLPAEALLPLPPTSDLASTKRRRKVQGRQYGTACPIATCDFVACRNDTEALVNCLNAHFQTSHRVHVNVLAVAPHLATNLTYDMSEVPDPNDARSTKWKCNLCGQLSATEANARAHCRKAKLCRPRQNLFATANPVWCNSRNKHPLHAIVDRTTAREAATMNTLQSSGLDFDPSASHSGSFFFTMLDENNQPVQKEIKNVKEFKYLGRRVTPDNRDERAINARLQSARATYFSLHSKFLKNKNISVNSKHEVWKSIVSSQLIYAAETCVITQRTARTLDTAHRSMLRQITGIQTYKNAQGEIRYPANKTIYKAAKSNRITLDIELQKLRFMGHLLRRPENSDLHFLLEASIPHLPSRHRGGKPQLIATLFALARNAGTNTRDAKLRSLWRSSCMNYYNKHRRLDQGIEPEPLLEDSDSDYDPDNAMAWINDFRFF